ncbi:16S rRNA (guanine(527)-N(7))-methyltransferase RsmG [Gammaproteobacteria bacterium]|jgi:16S rRNA (guanine527-N7)-methyltransferase|nr:16S rRNA (guanine(527)-N(7))-methyltransferase RsmG [Gammaproteobacteria bacterium]
MLEEIQKALDKLGQSFPDDTARRLAALLGELARWNEKVNLTAIRDPAGMISGHLLDSLVVRPLLQGRRILDVGTGAGFPGLPLAIVEPQRQFELIDGTGKKIQFVEHVIALLGLENVRGMTVRAEDYAPGEGFDTVIARAVAALPKLLEIAGHLVHEEGVFIAFKGRYPEEELKALPDTWSYSVEVLDVPGLEPGSRHAVLMRRKKP